MTRTVVALITILLITGCNTITTTPPERIQGKIPAIGLTSKTGVGETLYSEFDYLSHGHAIVEATEDFNWKMMGASISIERGQLLNCSQGVCCSQNTVWKSLWEKRVVCFSDADKDNVFEKMQVAMTVVGMESNLSYKEVSSSSTAIQVVDGYRQELVYQGVAAKVLTIGYREYKGDFARPAFFQDSRYDYVEGMTISFKGARLKVLKANQEGLEYQMISGFSN